MGDVSRNPRILVVTPEIAYLPEGMGIARHFSARAGGLADVSAALIRALFEQGADIHVALPDYRTIFGSRSSPFMKEKLMAIRQSIPDERIHLAEDRAFYLRPLMPMVSYGQSGRPCDFTCFPKKLRKPRSNALWCRVQKPSPTP